MLVPLMSPTTPLVPHPTPPVDTQENRVSWFSCPQCTIITKIFGLILGLVGGTIALSLLFNFLSGSTPSVQHPNPTIPDNLTLTYRK